MEIDVVDIGLQGPAGAIDAAGERDVAEDAGEICIIVVLEINI
jgi:hypothetical protein